MDSGEPKRKRTFRQEASRKKPKSDEGAQKASFSGFGLKMMQKMGWDKAQGGLGKDGTGISEPIQVRLRNTKGGVGAVSEKSEQQKREERRKAEVNGEKYEDSSEEERVRRRRKKVSGASTPSAAAPRPRKTIFDLEASGFTVPATLQSIVDATTGESKATSALSLRGAEVTFQTSLAGRVQREVAAFGEAVDAVQSDAKNIEFEMEHLAAELEILNTQMAEAEDIRSRLNEFGGEKEWTAVVNGLKSLHAAYPSRSFEKEAVAVIHPLFAQSIAGWDPASNALEGLAHSLLSLQSIIDPLSQPIEYQQLSTDVGRTAQNSLSSIYSRNTIGSETTNRRSTTPYQTMLLSWWGQWHSATMTRLQIDGPSASGFIHAIEVWKPLLPRFVYQRVIREIKQKLSATLGQWNARRRVKRSSEPLPTFVFQWLPYDTGLFTALKSQLRIVFQCWPLRKGVIPGIKLWKKAFPGEVDQLLIKHLLPRLSAHLRDGFEMDPADQDLEPLSAVISWSDVLSTPVIAELLHAEFFVTKFYPCLHSWLTYEGRVLDEISKWLAWWKDVFPQEIKNLPINERDWEEAYKLVNDALDLEEQGKDMDNLALPPAEPVHAQSPQTPNFSRSVNTEPPRSARQEVTETSFKDIVESWCAEENLLLMPLRKADETTGHPLFRITASATGKGGVVVYFKGDVIYAQNKKDKSVWEPVGLEEGLVARAEGK